MSSFGVVSDFVSGLHSYPLWYGSVHVHFVCEFTLDDERLVRTHFDVLKFNKSKGLTIVSTKNNKIKS